MLLAGQQHLGLMQGLLFGGLLADEMEVFITLLTALQPPLPDWNRAASPQGSTCVNHSTFGSNRYGLRPKNCTTALRP